MFQFADVDLGCGRYIMSELKQPKVRRCLFGRPDPIKLLDQMNNQERNVEDEGATEKFKEKWGLDPISGQPVEGSLYECVEVDPKRESIPSFYTKVYAPRKSRPVRRTMREKSPVPGIFSYLQTGRPLSAKRKLDLDDDDEIEENDENSRVPRKGEIVDTLPSSSPTLLSDSPDCRLCEPICQGGLSRSSSTSSLSELSPRIVDMITPPTRGKLTQSSIKDFLPLKKQCIMSSKSLPRT